MEIAQSAELISVIERYTIERDDALKAFERNENAQACKHLQQSLMIIETALYKGQTILAVR